MRNTLKKNPRPLSFVALALACAGLLSACPEPAPTSDGGTVTPDDVSVVFSAPRRDNTAYTTADDLDIGIDGIQTTVEVTYNGADSELTLDVESEGATTSYTASVSGITATFSDVLIPSGDPAVASILRIDASDADAVTRNVTGLSGEAPPLVACSFTNLTEGQTVEDANSDVPGVQISVNVNCTNSVGASAQVFATGADVAAVILDAAGNATAIIATPEGAEGSQELTVRLTDLSASASINVILPAAPVNCDATIVAPVDGAAFGAGSPDADTDALGFQTTVTVQVDESCDGGTVTVTGGEADVEAVIGEGGTAGLADLVVTLVEGSNTLSASVSLGAATGASASASVTYTTPVLAGIAFEVTGAEDCGTLGDACLNAADEDADSNTETFEANVAIVADAIDGACPFDVPVLSADDVALPNVAAWVLDGDLCRADFGAVTVFADLLPDAEIVALTTAVSVGEVSDAASYNLGLDRVLPYVNWFDADNAVFGIGADIVAGGNINYVLKAGVVGMQGSSVELLESGNVVGGCTPALDPDQCSESLDLPDGTYTFSARGTDQAGNAMLVTSRTLTFDSTRPCLESISLGSSTDLVLDAAEGNTQDVIVTLGAACALEDGQDLTLTSSLNGQLGSGAVSGNAITFSDVIFAEGEHVLTVIATDAAGNGIDEASNTVTVTVDTIAPSCSIVTPSAANLLAEADLDNAASDLQVSFQLTTDGSSLVFTDNGNAGGSEVVSGGALTSTRTLTQGLHAISITCSDDVGNVTTSAEYSVFVDSIAPTLAFDNPPAALGSTDDTDSNTAGVQATLAVTHGELEAGQTIGIFLADAQGQAIGASFGNLTLATGSVGTTATVNVPVSILGCADCSYVAAAEDTNGNAATSAPAAIAVDAGIYVGDFVNPNPASDPMNINIASDEDASTAGAQITITVTTDAPSGSTAELFVNGASVETVGVTGVNVTFAQVTLNATGTLEVAFDNVAASKSGTTGSKNYEVDLDAPTLTWVTPAVANEPIAFTANAPEGGSVATNDTTPGTAGYQGTVTLNVQGCAEQAVDVRSGGISVVNGALPVAGSDAEVTFNVEVSIPDGDNQTLVASCTDVSGNAVSSSLNGSVDTVKPAPSTTFTATVTDHARGNIDLEWQAPGDDGLAGTATLEIFSKKGSMTVNATNFDTEAADGTDLGLTAAGGVTTTSALTGYFFGNTYQFALRATDDLGNVSDVVSAEASPSLISMSFTQADDGDNPDFYGLVLNQTAGDLNNDGVNDFVFSAYDRGNNCAFGFCNGEVYVLYGQTSSAALQGASLQTLVGPVAGASLGYDLDIVPSLDGDGIDDLLVNTFAIGEDIAFFAGADNVNISDSNASWTTGGFADTVGTPVNGIGDVNGDGFQDFAVGKQPGGNRAFEIVFGEGTAPGAAQNYTANALQNVTLTNPNSSGPAPSNAVALGDVDGDFIDDFAVSFTDVSTGSQSQIFIVLGRSDWGNAAATQTMDVTIDPGFTLLPNGVSTKVGAQLSAGDINNDGNIDLVGVGNSRAQIWLNDGNGAFTASYFVRSLTAGASNSLARGGTVAGDLNADGFDDIVIRGDTGVDIFFGDARISGDRTEPDSTFTGLGPNQAEYIIGRPGDLDGDGAADITIGLASANSVWILHAP